MFALERIQVIGKKDAAEISDPAQTSMIYMAPVYQAAIADGHSPGRLPVREMLRQPGVSFVKEDRLPICPSRRQGTRRGHHWRTHQLPRG